MSRWDIEGYVAICKGQEGGFINAYMQTHTQRERERDRYIYICITIYIYTYTYLHKRVCGSGCTLKVKNGFGILGAWGFRNPGLTQERVLQRALANHSSGFRV